MQNTNNRYHHLVLVREITRADARQVPEVLEAAVASVARLRGILASAEDLAASARAMAALGDLDGALRAADSALRLLTAGPGTVADAVSSLVNQPLRVEPSGAWFISSDGKRQDCSTRPVLRRILRGLAEHRLRTPGVPLSRAQLLELGWPGERVLPLAAKNRLNVAVARLRRLGLDDWLQTVADGYRLDPARPLHIQEAEVPVVTNAM